MAVEWNRTLRPIGDVFRAGVVTHLEVADKSWMLTFYVVLLASGWCLTDLCVFVSPRWDEIFLSVE